MCVERSDKMGKVLYLFEGDKQMSNKITIFDIAKCFLILEKMTNKKLQKLCYYAQAWYLALNREPLVQCEFEAWIHGPVCPELYHSYKNHGYTPISRVVELPTSIKQDKYLQGFIKSIYDIYGDMSGDELELLTHNEEPWVRARQGLKEWEPSYNTISNDDMMEYYSSLQND